MKIKNIIVAILLVISLFAIVGLSVILHNTNTSLEAAQADIDGMSFVEGKVIENKNGGIVTASLKSWSYYQDDTFITESKTLPEGNLNSIFCSLHSKDLVYGLNKDLVKLKFSKKITVSSGETSKTYFLVGNYYISSTSIVIG